MKRRELINIGFQDKQTLKVAALTITRALDAGMSKAQIRSQLQALQTNPELFLEDVVFAELAISHRGTEVALASNNPCQSEYHFQQDLRYFTWGDDIEPSAHKQMQNACSLPIAVAGALMPDAHTGYGLPIGGVLATENAVIPYAVGVDIACRVMVSICDFPPKKILGERQKLERILEDNTRFGKGACFENKRQHSVLDEDWSITTITSGLKDKAWSQLGTSGSGNHFAEFGIVKLGTEFEHLEPGSYFALVTHSGSRGPGSKVALHYSGIARDKHPRLPSYLSHLAWLPMDDGGDEYWEAMQLMGRYASANHHVMHHSILKALGTNILFQVENHHNFAWKEMHHGKELIVHRKGATPAGLGVLGYIPGTMIDSGYIVRGLGNKDSLCSSSHGAGRKLSRKKAKLSTTYSELKKVLRESGVHLLSAGLDESPHAYKDIDVVMRAQSDLINPIAQFAPKIVKMAPED